MLRWILWICVAVPLWGSDARFSIQFTPVAPSLSDTIRVEVSLAGGGDDLVVDAADIPSACVRIQNVSGSATQQVVMLEPLRTGDCTVPPFRTRCLHGRKDSCGVQSSATVIPIHTLVADAEHADIRDKDELPLPFHDEEKQSDGWAWPITIIGGLLLLAVGYVVLRKWLAWRAKPATRALRRLKELKSVDDETAAFTQLMTILRDYLDERVGFGADRCTSPELAEALRERSLGHGSIEQTLGTFLAVCDRGRFAGRPCGPGELEGAVETCDTLIQCLDFDIERRLRAGL